MDSLLASSIYTNANVSGLITGNFSRTSDEAQGMINALTARYIDEPAVKLDLSDGLAAFIEENVTDETQKEALLKDLEAIQKLTAPEDSESPLIKGLLGMPDENSYYSQLNLLV